MSGAMVGHGLNACLPEEAKRVLRERQKQAQRRALDFWLLFSGRATQEVAARCLAHLEEYTAIEPSPTANHDRQAWHYIGQKHLVRWIRSQIQKGKEIEDAHRTETR